MPAALAGGTKLTGFVVDGAGLPVSGAEVIAELEKGAPDKALAVRSHGGSGCAARARRRGHRLGVGSLHAAVAVAPLTGADGRFVIDGIAPGRYRLRVTGSGLLAAEVRFVPVPSDEARIVVARQVAIEGTVTDGGKPVANAMVGMRGDAIGGTLEIKTDGKGAFSVPNLPEGRYQVYAWQGALAARSVRVNRLGAGPFGPLELRLEAGDDRRRPRDRQGRGHRARRGGRAAAGRRRSGAALRAHARRRRVPHRGRAERPLDRRRVRARLQLARRRRARCGQGRAGARARARRRDRRPRARRRWPSGRGRERARADRGPDADRDLGAGRCRQAAPVLRAHRGADRRPDEAFADPQFLARGELGVMLGPIPPIPPPGAAGRAAGRGGRSRVSRGRARRRSAAARGRCIARARSGSTGADGRYRIRGLPQGQDHRARGRGRLRGGALAHRRARRGRGRDAASMSC